MNMHAKTFDHDVYDPRWTRFVIELQNILLDVFAQVLSLFNIGDAEKNCLGESELLKKERRE